MVQSKQRISGEHRSDALNLVWRKIKGAGLHNVKGFRVSQTPAEDGTCLVQRVLQVVRHDVFRPQTDKSRLRMDVRMSDGLLEVELKRHGRKKAWVTEFETVRVEDGGAVECAAGQSTERQSRSMSKTNAQSGIECLWVSEAIFVAIHHAEEKDPFRLSAPIGSPFGEGRVSHW